MRLKALWQRWFNRPPSRRPRPAPRTQLAMECLERREALATFTASTVPELIGAITVANQSAEADTITLAPGKTFTLTAVNNTDHGATGLPVIAAGGGGLTIVGNGDVIQRSASKGTPSFRLLNVAAEASLTLQNLTLQGGYLDSGTSSYASNGGAVYNAGSLSVTGVTVQNNTARGQDGGGLFAQGGNAEGGAIYSSGALMVANSTIRNNLAVGGRGGQAGDGGWANGGGVQIVGGTATLLGTTITGNDARAGTKGTGFWVDPIDGGRWRGHDGRAYGGGLSIRNSLSVYVDAFTVDHITNNKATTGSWNTDGSYTLLS